MTSYAHQTGGNGGFSHGLLGLLMLGLSALLAVAISFALGIQLPDLKQTLTSLGFGETLHATETAKAATPAAPFCAEGQRPTFVLGFATLKQRLGEPMGEPLECEHVNSDNGDTVQHTSTGLAYYRKATNTPTFTNGWEHWALTGEGLVYWTGDSADPPPGAQPLGP